MRGVIMTIIMSAALLLILCGCVRYGSYYYFPTYPYEYADPYNDYFYYNYYLYSYPYGYRFPPPPYYYDERTREFRHEERKEQEEPGKKEPEK